MRVKKAEKSMPFWALTVTVLSLIILSCNIFEPLADDIDEQSYAGLIESGNEAIRNKQYERAQQIFERAMRINPKGSEAYLFHSKAIMKRFNLNYSTINNEFERKKQKGATGVPFLDSNTTIKGIDSVYYPVATSVQNLEHILAKRNDTIFLDPDSLFALYPDGDTASDGKISNGVATLDLGLLQAIEAVLRPMDKDNSLHIDSICGQNICPDLSPACTTSTRYTEICDQGILTEAILFENYKTFTSKVTLDSLNTDSLDPKELSNDPNDLNGFLDAMRSSISGSNKNLGDVNASLLGNRDTALAKELGEAVGSIRDLDNFLQYMRFNDSADNDLDHPNPSYKPLTNAERMVWHDYDQDGYIRWDYNENLQNLPQPASRIGHPLHRWLHQGNLYLTIDSLMSRHPRLQLDTTKNSRIALMIDKCQKTMDDMEITGAVTPELFTEVREQICSTYSTVLLPGTTRPVSSDWVSGTFGVDEEVIDDRDNDYDGLKDEDSRNMNGADDDDDGLLTLDMLGTTPPYMQWSDKPSHLNQCIDIDTTQSMDPQNPRKNCLGTYENRMHLARNNPSMLDVYYSLNPSESNRKDCIDDIEKRLPDSVSSIYTTAEKNKACEYKHIWIAPRPPNSEWISGTYGIDEEKLDGEDNDGDGWVDEDVRWP